MNITTKPPELAPSNLEYSTGSTASDNRVFADMLAQQISQTAADRTEQARQSTTDTQDAKSNTREALMRMLEMTPAERIRYSLLHKMGLTEAELLNLPPDVRMKIEAMIKEEVERQLAGTDGEPQPPAST
ncbi:MAG: hypothetical protein GYB41_06930 [Oceanospirillales bacterium]|nr:hypothetical protein [Oceanospirillales bacterium]